MTKYISIVMPNYNGKLLLETYLPSVIDAVSRYGGKSEILVVDDGSSDGSVEFLKNKYPSVRVLRLEKNVGFGRAVNAGMEQSNGNIVILLNNDVEVDNKFISPLIAHFDNPDVFAVTACGRIPEGNYQVESISKLIFEDGMLKLIQPGLIDPSAKWEKACTVAHACGGYSAFDRQKFLQLGGFDDLFIPFYWEDVDICYSAWKKGWWVIYEPKSMVTHHVHSTINKVARDQEYIDMMLLRNQLLFTWKNITDAVMLEEHARRINLITKEAPEQFKKSFYEALKKIMDVLRKRGERVTEGCDILKDKEILILSSNLKYPDEAIQIRREIAIK